MELLFLFVWLPLCFVVGYVASQKGRSGIGMFFLSLFLSPLIGLLATIALPDRRPMTQPSGAPVSDSGFVMCPSCGRPRPTDRTFCPHCQALRPSPPEPHAGEKKCPACAEWIKQEALKCRYCGEAQTATPAISPATVGFLGYCPKCGNIRHSKAPYCTYCRNADPVVAERSKHEAAAGAQGINWGNVDRADRNTGRPN